MLDSDSWVDNAAHLLYFGGRSFPCDRDIEALAAWNGHALLLSADTDCLSLWDSEGLVRTARVGVYPQDMAVWEDTAVICGGADGHIHLVSLPELYALADYPVPGMPERLCVHGGAAHLLTLLTDPDVHTALLALDLTDGRHAEVTQFAGIPGAIAADEAGLWVGVSERVLHLPWGTDRADMAVEGFGLAKRILLQDDGMLVVDPVEGLQAKVMRTPRPAVKVLYRGDVGQVCFTR